MSCPSPTRLSAPDFAHLQDGRTQKLEKAKVSLNDCLACSGCVTSAETVLITQQSHEELRKVLDANKVSSGDQTSHRSAPDATAPQRMSSGEAQLVHLSGSQ